MKLNNFLQRTEIVKPKRKVFTLENEAKDQKYLQQIVELEQQLEQYAVLEGSFEELKRTTSKLQESHVDSNVLLSKSEERVSILNLDLTQAQEKLDSIPEFEETIKGLKGSLSDKSNELDKMQKVAHQQSSDLTALRGQIEGLQKIIGTLHESVSDNCPYLHESINETINMFGNIRLDINKMMSQHHYESEVYVVDA